MFGLENDTNKSVEDRKQYILSSAIDSFLVTVYTPLPGSKIFDKLYAENKLIYTNFPEDWGYYNFHTNHLKENKIDDLPNTFEQIRKEIRSSKYLISKFFLAVLKTRSISSALYSNFYFFNHEENEFEKVFILKVINWWTERIQKKYYRSSQKNSKNDVIIT